MLAEIAAANADSWRPRWYYVMRNKTSGIQYVGQTYNLHTRSYCGSGRYWVAHCKKHGGYSKKNIELVHEFWAVTPEQAQAWLDDFEVKNPNYFLRSNTAWANRARETTGNSAFCGVTKEKRKEYARAGGLASAQMPGHMSKMASIQGRANTESGHIQQIQKIGCVLGGKINGPIVGRMMAESGHMAKICVMGGAAVSAARHKNKDPDTGKSLFAIKIGQASGRTRKLMAEFCKLKGIAKPGSNYCNIDKEAFQRWKAEYVG
jgi:hypothetical protein